MTPSHFTLRFGLMQGPKNPEASFMNQTFTCNAGGERRLVRAGDTPVTPTGVAPSQHS